MEPIHVPRPPKEAFDKNRRVSDLIRKQVQHFKHLEHKLPDEVRRKLPQHQVISEDDAARYIAAMTSFLLRQPSSAVGGKSETPAISRPVDLTNGTDLTMAAALEKRPDKKRRGAKRAKKSGARSRKGKKG